MVFELTREQHIIQEMVKDFVEKEIKPIAIEIDAKSLFAEDVFKKMGKLGFMGIPFPEQYGGSGGDTIFYAIAVEEIGKAYGGTGLSYAATVSLGASPIYYFGTEEQKQNYYSHHLEENNMANIKASMAGSVWKIVVSIGDLVDEGQELIILESMKMEIPIAAEIRGAVKEINVQEGDFVNEGDVLAVVE
jgi:biotin carboxyl carrier protein